MYAVTTDYGHPLPQEGSYRTIEAVAGALGCTKDMSGVLSIIPNLAAALFVTALCGRHFGVGLQPPVDIIAPWNRLARMMDKLCPSPGRFDMSDEEAGALVDQVARRHWGRTAFEEIAADIYAMEAKVDLVSVPWLADNGLYAVYTDFVALRRSLLAVAQRMGFASVLPRAFPFLWRNKLLPWHVVATPGGRGSAQGDEDDLIVFGRRLNLPPALRAVFSDTVVWGRSICRSSERSRRAIRTTRP